MMMRFILETEKMKGDRRITGYDFIQTSDDVLLLVEGTISHKELIDLLATEFRLFGLELSKKKCIEAYYDPTKLDDEKETGKMVLFFNSTYYDLTNNARKISDYQRILRVTTIAGKTPELNQRTQTLRKEMSMFRQDIKIE